MDMITTVQEVLFDLIDLLDNNDLTQKINGFEEFSNLREFILEQKTKMEELEGMLE